MNTERIKETRSVVEDDVVVGPQGFHWIVEDVNGNQIRVRRIGTRENTRTITEAHLEGDGGFRPKNKQRGETKFNKDKIKSRVKSRFNKMRYSKDRELVTVRVGQRDRSNDLYNPMYSPQLFDEILEEYVNSGSYGRYVEQAINRGFVGVEPDLPRKIGMDMKRFMRQRKQLFAREGRDYRDPDTKDTWTNIADRFIQSDPDYERTGWEDYNKPGGHRMM